MKGIALTQTKKPSLDSPIAYSLKTMSRNEDDFVMML